MRLSDVKGDRTLDVIADIIDPIANIAEDGAAASLFHREKLPEGQSPKEFMLRRVRKHLPQLLKSHKEDIIAILAAIEGVSAAEYAEKLDLVKLTKDFTELLTDEAFTQLFISAQSGMPSGSAPESTTEP